MSDTNINVRQMKDLVREALAMEWDVFAARHPRLAAVLDQEILIQQVGLELGDDPDYLSAMQEAAAAGMGAAALAHVVRTFVKDWLVRLL